MIVRDKHYEVNMRIHGRNYDGAMGWSAIDLLQRFECGYPISPSELMFLNDSDFATANTKLAELNIFGDRSL